MILNIFGKMRASIDRKVQNGEPGLYVSLLFPIFFSFIVAFVGSRIVGYLITYGYLPEIYLEPSPGLHVHHFTYGVFILFIAGFIALIVNGPRAKFWTAMLMGFGLGLAMDEFGMWLHLRDDDIVRWSYDGFNITIGLFLLILTAKPGFKMLKKLWPFGRREDS